MDFAFDENQQMLADSLSRYLADRYDWNAHEAAIESKAGFSRALWNGLADLGVIGSWFGAEVGGYGGSPFDIAATFERFGHALVTGPTLTCLLSGKILEAAGDTHTLKAIIEGELIVAFANEPSVDEAGRTAPIVQAVQHSDGWRVSGAKGLVAYMSVADRIIVTAEGDHGISSFLVRTDAPGISIRDYPLIDGGSAGELDLKDVEASLIGQEGQAEKTIQAALASGLVAIAWEAVGIMDAMRDSTLEYLRTRKQFGVSLGQFQALRHRMATVALEIEQARSSAINAAANFDTGVGKRDKYCSAAKFTIGTVGTLIAEEAIQMHGGIGMTWELPLSHYAKRLIMLNHLLGDEDHHLARYMAIGQAA